MTSRPIRLAASLAATALAGSVLAITAPAAHAAPVFVDADTVVEPFSYANNYTGGTCVVTETSSSPNTDVPVVENGPVTTATSFVTATVDDGGPVLANLA